MASDIRLKSIDLIHQLVMNCKKYNLFQMLHILEKSYADKNFLNGDMKKSTVYLQSTTELSFPIADIQLLSYENYQIKLLINIFGLHGVDSPLPQYWLVDIVNNSKSLPLNKFLNIFQNRLYTLFYMAWKKFQTFLSGENNYLYYLESLSGGLLQPEIDDIEYAYAGLLGRRVHNAETLKTILSNYLVNIPVIVSQFIPQWTEVDNVVLSSDALSNVIISETALLGKRVLDVSHTILITLGPISLSKSVVLLTDRGEKDKLLRIINLYVGLLFNVRILLKMLLSRNSYSKLGKDKIYLGWNSCVGNIDKEIFILFSTS